MPNPAWFKNGNIATRIGKHHLAFMRAYVEGLSLPDIAERYLGIDPDAPAGLSLGKETLRWLRSQFLRAGKRSKKLPNPRLIFIAPERLHSAPSPARQTSIPTLEEFVEEYGYDDFSEAEQLEAWQARSAMRVLSKTGKPSEMSACVKSSCWPFSIMKACLMQCRHWKMHLLRGWMVP
jgi:hypothetical protein